LEGYGVASLLPKNWICAYIGAGFVCIVPFAAMLAQYILVSAHAEAECKVKLPRPDSRSEGVCSDAPFPFGTLMMDSMSITCYASVIVLSMMGLRKLYQGSRSC